MQKLSRVAMGKKGIIAAIDGDFRFLNRITSIGLTIGTEIEVMQNEKKLPILIFSRDTLVAINKEECNKIMVEVDRK